jgi:hypothetical protein
MVGDEVPRIRVLPGDKVKVSGQPFRSQTMWILVVRPPRLRPRAWSMGSWCPPFYRLQRRPGWRGSTSNRSSRYPDPSGHPLASGAGDVPGQLRRCRHRATGGSGRRRSSKDHRYGAASFCRPLWLRSRPRYSMPRASRASSVSLSVKPASMRTRT